MSRKIDLTGQKFGRLTVIAEAGKSKRGRILWHCVCECGNERIVVGENLRSGGTKSCGCFQREQASKCKKIDLVGEKFERLTVVSEFGRDSHGRILWLCYCDCGNKKIISADRLRRGYNKSCSCLRKDWLAKRNREKRSLPMERRLFKSFGTKAKSRGLAWGLSLEEATKLWQSPCAYCDTEPSNRFVENDREIVYSGIDRIDSSLGYVPGNVQSCCKRCNAAKNNLAHEEFLALVSRIYIHQDLRDFLPRRLIGTQIA